MPTSVLERFPRVAYMTHLGRKKRIMALEKAEILSLKLQHLPPLPNGLLKG